MPGTPTTRRSLPTLNASSDLVSAYPATNLAQMDNLDTAMDYLEGTLVSRPAASAVLAGTVYRATDLTVGQWSQSDGTNWLTVMLAGAWVALTLGSGLGTYPGTYTPAARLVSDMVTLRGMINNVSAGSISTVGTIPAGLRPASPALIDVITVNSGGTPFTAYMNINTNGTLVLTAAIVNSNQVSLDGIAFSLA